MYQDLKSMTCKSKDSIPISDVGFNMLVSPRAATQAIRVRRSGTSFLLRRSPYGITTAIHLETHAFLPILTAANIVLLPSFSQSLGYQTPAEYDSMKRVA
jgi:hypothetical protein